MKSMRTNFIIFPIFHFKCVCVYMCICIHSYGRWEERNNTPPRESSETPPSFLSSIFSQSQNIKIQTSNRFLIQYWFFATSNINLTETIALFQVFAFLLSSRISVISLTYLFSTELKTFTIWPCLKKRKVCIYLP